MYIFCLGIINRLNETKYLRLNSNSEARDDDEFSASIDLDSILILMDFKTYMPFQKYCQVSY